MLLSSAWVPCGCQGWGTLCSESLRHGLKGMVGLQLASSRQGLKLRTGISPPVGQVGSAKLADFAWKLMISVLGLHAQFSMAEGSLHPDVLTDNIHDA